MRLRYLKPTHKTLLISGIADRHTGIQTIVSALVHYIVHAEASIVLIAVVGAIEVGQAEGMAKLMNKDTDTHVLCIGAVAKDLISYEIRVDVIAVSPAIET